MTAQQNRVPLAPFLVWRLGSFAIYGVVIAAIGWPVRVLLHPAPPVVTLGIVPLVVVLVMTLERVVQPRLGVRVLGINVFAPQHAQRRQLVSGVVAVVTLVGLFTYVGFTIAAYQR